MVVNRIFSVGSLGGGMVVVETVESGEGLVGGFIGRNVVLGDMGGSPICLPVTEVDCTGSHGLQICSGSSSDELTSPTV